MKHFVPFLLVGLVAASIAASCSSSDEQGVTTTVTSAVSSSSAGSGGSAGGGGGGGPLLDGPCDPLVPSKCGLPFPSNVYLVDDPKTPTMKHVEFGATTLPANKKMKQISPDAWKGSDGFSPGQAPLTDLPGASVTGLPTQDTIDLSITKDSPTILLDVETGMLVPHFAELDVSSASGDGDHMFMIRPVVRLRDGARYIVAIRHVVDDGGNPIAPSPAFQALRDGTSSTEASVERRRTLYEDIFLALDKAGVKKDDLQIAWDYSTASRENNTRWLVHMRDEALKIVGDQGPAYAIDSVEDNPNQYIRMRIHGHMTVPLYLDKPGPGGRLVFGPDGMPKQNGTADYEFLVHIPNSAANGTPGYPLQNGHGLLGDKAEGQNGYLAQIADTKHYVAFGVDLVGMASDDENTIVGALLGDISDFQASIDRQHQGLLNSLLAMRMMKGGFVKEPMIQFNGKSAIDPSQCFYRGDSQGGIFGATYMAISTDVTRGLLGEPGMPYGLLLNRSVDFDPFFVLLKSQYKDGRDIQLILGLVQMLWDRTEPDGYAPYIAENMLPDTPKHDILIHDAIGDHQVTPLGAHIIARGVHAQNLNPVNRTLFGLPNADGPFTGSGIVEYSFGLPDSPKTNTPPTGPDSDDPHDKVRVLDAAINSTDEFFRNGDIKQFCSGVCDPE